jgi:hypothetical protein
MKMPDSKVSVADPDFYPAGSLGSNNNNKRGGGFKYFVCLAFFVATNFTI